LKKQDIDFLSENMSIDVDWLEREFNSPDLIPSKKLIESYISSLVCAASHKKPKEKILEKFEAVTPLNEKTDNYEIFESLRHAFTSFTTGGLFDLYVYQSNESWYPKIVLKSELKPNDIENLSGTIDIFRGCNISEFDCNKYGQSWSTSMQVAKEFAYKHYASQSWYEEEKRCVLKAIIKKEDVLFSRQNHHEKEIVVNIDKLVSVQKT
jgi:hypothetical protein